MAVNIEKLRSDIKYESRKFAVQLVLGFAAALGAGIALANYVNSRPAAHAAPPATVTAPASPTR